MGWFVRSMVRDASEKGRRAKVDYGCRSSGVVFSYLEPSVVSCFPKYRVLCLVTVSVGVGYGAKRGDTARV